MWIVKFLKKNLHIGRFWNIIVRRQPHSSGQRY